MRAPLHIQQASAGSGKTYALTKTYIRLLISVRKQGRRALRSDEELRNSLSHILAVTFTNKATNEMKHRIVKSLYELSTGKNEKGGKADYLEDFAKEFGTSEEKISEICGKALRQLLLNYSDFQVSTIDSFFQSILHTFTYETELGEGFNLEIDSDYIAAVSVDATLDKLITREKKEEETEGLVQNLMNLKANSNQWNIYQRQNTSRSLYNHLINNVKNMEKEDYKGISEKLKEYFDDPSNSLTKLITYLCDRYEKPVREAHELQKRAAKALEEAYIRFGIDKCQYSRYTSSRIDNVKKMNFDPPKQELFLYQPYDEKTKGISLGTKFRKDKLKEMPNAVLEMDELYKEFVDANIAWRKALDSEGYRLWRVYGDQLVYLGLLNRVAEMRREFLAASNIVEISDTNSLLKQIISDEETPFIYERMGTRINHYLIDEFQDTSLMQWENLEPLLSESIANDDDNLIIGDAKQSIYRFRNADHTLISDTLPAHYAGRSDWSADPIPEDPAQAAEQKEKLNTNWRSDKRVVEFNNYFFRALTDMKKAKEEDTYYFPESIRKLYQNCEQPVSPKARKHDRGYIEVNIKIQTSGSDGADDKDEEEKEGFGYEQLGDTIMALRARGYKFSDIGVLVRKNKHGNQAVEAITRYNQTHTGEKIPFISDQSLLVEKAYSVQLVILVLNTLSKGDVFKCDERWTDTLAFDINHLNDIFKNRPSISLVSLIETIIEEVVPENLKEKETPYLAAFQDAVLDFSNTNSSDIASFLQWWDRQKSKLSIISPEEADAVRIITVHKSKGLEYNCVIIPEADFSFQPSSKNTEWLWVEPQIESELPLPPYIPVETTRKLEGTPHEELWLDYNMKIALDGLNSAYVAFTRAKYELYIFAAMTPRSGQGKLVTSLNKLCEAGGEDGENAERGLLSEPIVMESILTDLSGNILEEAGMDGLALNPKEVIRFNKFTYGEKTDPDLRLREDETERREKKLEQKGGSDKMSAKDSVTSITLKSYSVNYDNEALKFRPGVLNSFSRDLSDENIPEWLKHRDEGTLKHSIMSMVKREKDLHQAILKHKITGKISGEQAVKWEKELRDAIGKVNEEYCWFGDGYEILNERSIQRRGKEDKRPDRIMVSKGNDVVIVDYKFGHKTNVNAYRRQVREYMELLSETNIYDDVKGYVWYVESGVVEEIKVKD